MLYDFERLYSLIVNKIVFWFEVFVGMLPNLLLAIFVVWFAVRFSRLIRKMADKYFHRFLENDSVIKIGVTIASYIVIFIGFYIALAILNFHTVATTLVAGVGVVGLALSFAFQDLATNFISGVFMVIEKPFMVGDFIETGDYEGHIQEIGLRAITIRTLDEQHIIIPSKEIFQNPIKNYNSGRARRITINVGVSYGEDLDRVSKISEEALADIPEINKNRPVLIQYNEFGSSSINFDLRFWVKRSDPLHFHEVRSKVIVAIKKAYDANGIVIPFPIRTLDFGIKAGEALKEHLGE
jgi:small-conductance mechanosensitive channel